MKLLKRVGEAPIGLDGLGRWRKLMGMKQILVMMAALVLVGCGDKSASPTPKGEPKVPPPATEAEVQVTPVLSPEPKTVPSSEEKLIADLIVEQAIRESLGKPRGELTERDAAVIKDLHLDGSQITDEGLKNVAKLQHLERLDLSDTKITDAGLKEVAKLQKLKSLRLNDTEISDEGLKEVAKLKKLEKLDLNFTQITDNGAAELQKALPNCRISAPNPPRRTP